MNPERDDGLFESIRSELKNGLKASSHPAEPVEPAKISVKVGETFQITPNLKTVYRRKEKLFIPLIHLEISGFEKRNMVLGEIEIFKDRDFLKRLEGANAPLGDLNLTFSNQIDGLELPADRLPIGMAVILRRLNEREQENIDCTLSFRDKFIGSPRKAGVRKKLVFDIWVGPEDEMVERSYFPQDPDIFKELELVVTQKV